LRETTETNFRQDRAKFISTEKRICQYREEDLSVQGRGFVSTGKRICQYKEEDLSVQGRGFVSTDKFTFPY
jgi:hypothetical protein